MNFKTLLAIILILAIAMLYPEWNKFYYENISPKQPYPKATENAAPKKISEEKSVESLKPAQNSIQEKVLDTFRTLQVNKDFIVHKVDTIWIETESMIAGISTLGARLVSIKMKNYRIDHGKQDTLNNEISKYVDLVPVNSSGGAGVTINNENFDDKNFTFEGLHQKQSINKSEQKEITFNYTKDNGIDFKKKFTFKGQGNEIKLTLIGNNLNSNRITMSWLGGIFESEAKFSFYQAEERKAHYSDGKTVLHFNADKPAKEESAGFYNWIGISSKYFFIGLVADSINDADIKIIATPENQNISSNGKKEKVKKINYGISYQYTGQSSEAHFLIYAGPSEYKQLKKYNIGFEKILFPVLGWTKIFFWSDVWFPPLANFVLWLLLWLFGLVKDYGIAIIILTIISKIVTFPLTQSSMKSMNKMKDIQPKVTALREKFKSNPKKMNEAIMAMYKEEGVNPLNPGCLPMFLQMPIFIALFVVLQKAIELRGASTILLPWVGDLSQAEQIFSFEHLIPGGIPFYGSNFAILPIIMAVLTFVQNKMTIKDPNQKMLIYFMPIFMLVLFNQFSSGLVLYWTVQSALGLVQQLYTNRLTEKSAAQKAPVVIPTRKSSKRR